jgi:hypothetical protein
MILVRCDSCGKTVECPDGYKPDDWRQLTDAKTRQVFHSCSVQCRGTLAEHNAGGWATGASRSWHDMSPAQQAELLSNDGSFATFLVARGYQCAAPAEAIRSHCGVNSRADIKPGTRAAQEWNDLVSDYRAWMKEPELVG